MNAIRVLYSVHLVSISSAERRSLLPSSGIVHTVTGAMLMLNTDLHIAELDKHMSRLDFVRNSIRAIQESMPLPDRGSTPDLISDDGTNTKVGFGSNYSAVKHSTVNDFPKTPLVPLNAPRSASAPVYTLPRPYVREDRQTTANTSARASSMSINSFNYSKAWEVEAETALKVCYSYWFSTNHIGYL